MLASMVGTTIAWLTHSRYTSDNQLFGVPFDQSVEVMVVEAVVHRNEAHAGPRGRQLLRSPTTWR
jgi:hypothetical protein